MSIRIVLIPQNAEKLSLREKLKLKAQQDRFLTMADEVVYVMKCRGEELDSDAVNIYLDEDFNLSWDRDFLLSDDDRLKLRRIQENIDRLRGKK